METDYISLSSNKVNTDLPVFIPVGSIEIHGKTLPLGTDTYIAMASAKKFAQKVQGVTFPPVILGICSSTGRFKETVSLTHEGFILYLKDIVSDLIARGFDKIVIINIHKENDTAIRVVVRDAFHTV